MVMVKSTTSLFICVLMTGTFASLKDEHCYHDPLPHIPISSANRTVPWGEPSITFSNGTTCCSSLDQVRDGINAVDSQLLQLLSDRAAYVREATRFKSTYASVNVPSRDKQVIQGAVDAASSVHLPQIVAKKVYEAIINSSIIFEYCVFDSYHGKS